MSASTLKCVVSGRVQGVFYRASTANRAQELGIDGWVRNRPDGRVELVVSGDAEALETMIAWLWTGPPSADVSGVTLEEYDAPVEPGFSVVR